MSCNRGKANPNLTVKLKLFADSGGFCQNPSCLKELFIDYETKSFHIAEFAHIISVSDDGPRSDKCLTEEEKGEYKNLILLCANCHIIIDKAEEEYPEGLIKKWKAEHTEKIKQLFSSKRFTSREEVKNEISRYFIENKTIFDIYGPNTEERFNPESTMPESWIIKIKEKIIPNNRKIINIIDCNRSLLKESEIETVEILRQHINDFELRHIFNEEVLGIQFPTKAVNLFKD